MSYGPPPGGGFGGPPPGGFGPPGGYPPPGYGGPPPPTPGMGGPPHMGMGFGPMTPPPQSNQLAIASLVCGIVAFPGMCCCYTSIPFGIIALVTGIIAMRRSSAQPEMYGSGKGMAIAGIACGSAALLLTLVAFAFHLTSRLPNYAP